MRSLLTVGDLTRNDVERILDRALKVQQQMATPKRYEQTRRPLRTLLAGKTVASLFFEPSTRTATSFELAARRLGADVLSFRGSGSSLEKGETFKDTVQTLCAYGLDTLVIRHSQAGAPALAEQWSGLPVLNAGDGTHQHPTQALLDLFTIQQHVCRQTIGLKVAIVGDVRHSRVVRSLVPLLKLYGIEVRLVGPPTLLPNDSFAAFGCETSSDIAAIEDVDVVYALRMQKERIADGSLVPSAAEYHARWGITRDRLRPEQWLMHPGPLNRGVEVSGEVADSPQSLVLTQVAAGLPVRMSCFCELLDVAYVG